MFVGPSFSRALAVKNPLLKQGRQKDEPQVGGDGFLDDGPAGSSGTSQVAREQLKNRAHVLGSLGQTEAAFEWGKNVLDKLEKNPEEFNLEGFLTQEQIDQMKERAETIRSQNQGREVSSIAAGLGFEKFFELVIDSESLDELFLSFAIEKLGANKTAIRIEQQPQALRSAIGEPGREKINEELDKIVRENPESTKFLKDVDSYKNSLLFRDPKLGPYSSFVAKIARQVVYKILGLYS